MFEIVLVSHGNLAQEMINTAELIAGKQNNIKTFGLNLGDDIDSFSQKVQEYILSKTKKGKILVLTDIQSGSPFNTIVGIMHHPEIKHITGMNLPMLIEILCLRKFQSIDEIFKDIIEKSRQCIINVNEFLNQCDFDDNE